MPDALNALAAEAAVAYPGGTAYTYAAQDALSARVLIVEEGGSAFPQGINIGKSQSDPPGKWGGILSEAGYEPGMYSWWNAIPCGLDRPSTAEDRGRGGSFLRRAIGLHLDLHAVIAVGMVAQGIVKSTRTEPCVFSTRSPLRSSNAERRRVIDTFIKARLRGYPAGFER